jgi:hypothetical protein
MFSSHFQMIFSAFEVLEDRQSADAVCFGSALAACGVGEKWQEAQAWEDFNPGYLYIYINNMICYDTFISKGILIFQRDYTYDMIYAILMI